MDSEQPIEMPKGKRYLYKKLCVNCRAKGYIITYHNNKCSECSGLGWVYDKRKKEVICPICDGLRTIVCEEKEKCNDCNGVGYSVHIMQDYKRRVSCTKCQKKGLINCDICDGKPTKKCKKCKGSGSVIEGSGCEHCGRSYVDIGKQYMLYNIKWWMKQGEIQRKVDCLEYIQWHSLGNPTMYIDRFIAKSRFCTKCKLELLKVFCPHCNSDTSPRIREYIKECCDHCIHRKIINCNKCNGCGILKCLSCNSKGVNKCPDCRGNGEIITIIQKEV
jgi:hypothetical protein